MTLHCVLVNGVLRYSFFCLNPVMLKGRWGERMGTGEEEGETGEDYVTIRKGETKEQGRRKERAAEEKEEKREASVRREGKASQ